MKTLQPDILYLNRKERKSLLIVVIFLIASSFADEAFVSLSSLFFHTDKNYSSELIVDLETSPENRPALDKTKFLKRDSIIREIGKLETDSIRVIQNEIVSIPKKTLKAEGPKINLFNPNDVDEETLLSIGLNSFASRNWIKYLEAGGRFYKEEDLNKIYGVDPDKITEIKSRLLFPKKPFIKQKSFIKPFDINTGIAEDFRQVQGIGKVLSERIIKFRDKLGGFHNVEQIKEVYGIDSSIIEMNYSIFQLDSEVRKININSMSEIELCKHPYFTTAISKSIVNNRRQNGNFINADDLLRIKIIQESWVRKVEPYIDF